MGEEQRVTAKLSDSLKTISRFYVNAEKEIQKIQLNKSSNKADDDTSNAEETFDRDYFDTMSDYYGFSEEDAKAIKEAYEAFENSDLSKNLNNKENINCKYSHSRTFNNYYRLS